jgi:hypothetical protein
MMVQWREYDGEAKIYEKNRGKRRREIGRMNPGFATQLNRTLHVHDPLASLYILYDVLRLYIL